MRPPLDMADPRVALESYVKLRGSTLDATIYEAYDGELLFFCSEGVGAPLISFRGVRCATWRREPSGWSCTEYDAGYFVDNHTQEELERWRNPISGRELPVSAFCFGTRTEKFSLSSRSGTCRWSMAGGQLWHTQTSLAPRSNPLRRHGVAGCWVGDPESHVTTCTYTGRIDEVMDPDLHQVPAVHVGMRSTAAPPWMQLGRIAGRAEWRWVGAKCGSVDQLDPHLAGLLG